MSLVAVGDAVRDARRERGWSQTHLGEIAGVSRPTIARIERGDDVSMATLIKLATALRLTVKIEAAKQRTTTNAGLAKVDVSRRRAADDLV